MRGLSALRLVERSGTEITVVKRRPRQRALQNVPRLFVQKRLAFQVLHHQILSEPILQLFELLFEFLFRFSVCLIERVFQNPVIPFFFH